MDKCDALNLISFSDVELYKCFRTCIGFLRAQDVSDHDGDWSYYKQQAHEQKIANEQLQAVLKAYGFHLPVVRTIC